MNLRWAWDDRTRDLFRWVDPDAWDATRHDPVELLGHHVARAARRAGRRPGVPPLPGVGPRGPDPLPRGAPLVPEPRPSGLRQVAYFSPEFGIAEALPQYSGGLGILAGDHLKSASDLGRAARGRRPLLPPRLLPPGPRPATAGSRSASPTRTRSPCRSPSARASGSRWSWPASRCEAQVWRADVGRIPLYLLDADVEENPDELRGRHRPALRRRRRAPAAPGDPPRHRRRAGPRGAGHRRPGVPHQRGPRRLPRARAHAPVDRRRRPHLRRGGRGHPRRVDLHHPHPGPRRHRPLPPRADRALLRRLGRRVRRHRRRAHGARPPAQRGRAAEPDDERFNMAVMGLRLAGRSNAVAKLHGAVSREMFNELWPDLEPDEVPDQVGHQRRPRRHLGVGRHDRPARPPRPARVGRGRRRELGPRLAHARRRAVAGQGAGPRPAGRLRARCACKQRAHRVSGISASEADVGRRPARPGRPHHRLRPPLRHLQAGQPAAGPGRAAPGAAARPPTGPCSSSSPARPTPPTTRARR